MATPSTTNALIRHESFDILRGCAPCASCSACASALAGLPKSVTCFPNEAMPAKHPATTRRRRTSPPIPLVLIQKQYPMTEDDGMNTGFGHYGQVEGSSRTSLQSKSSWNTKDEIVKKIMAIEAHGAAERFSRRNTRRIKTPTLMRTSKDCRHMKRSRLHAACVKAHGNRNSSSKG